jgi:TATA-box binding protein (TBP) (component of TFIID and TFIIIB)
MAQPKISNVKISFRYPATGYAHDLKEVAYRVTSSYILVKKQYTYTIYHKSNLVNVTGIPSFNDISLALKVFHGLTTDQSSPIISVKVDNTTASGQFPRKIKIQTLQVRYNPSLFPGASLRLTNKTTALLFRSGKYVIVGGKSEAQIQQSFDLLQEQLTHCDYGLQPFDHSRGYS